ncbi:hypothetical protein [Streptomyces sp. P17]|uniref:hypothetical protein n=1 Tax=Streptomyces sp. P17 TaxID=3074716 RepID=UPI0028F3F05B|nr:hypothetical protein [Streptomyces sp. P17]MDT9697914.1 hypothetical protein [Streptomyces sp. P17]
MSTPPEQPADPEPPPRRSPASTFVEKAAIVAAPSTVTFALLYYFGSLYIKAYYSTLGVLPEDLGFSVQGIVASSTSAIFVPLCGLLAGGLVVFLVFGWLGRALAGPDRAVRRRTAIVWLLTLGVALMMLGLPVFFTDLVSLFPEGWARRFIPALMVAVGATLAICAVHLRLSESTGIRVRAAPAAERTWLAGGTMLIGLLTVSLFFAMAQYVADIGRGDAQLDAEEGYRDTPWVVVHSKVPLAHHAKNIRFRDYGSENAPYRYEYKGFRMLAKAPGRFYLVSGTSRYHDRRVVMLPDDGTAWLEIRGA